MCGGCNRGQTDPDRRTERARCASLRLVALLFILASDCQLGTTFSTVLE